MSPDIPNCSSPLVFETDLADYPYGISGTGFLCTYSGLMYFVTARHCLEAGDQERLRVPASFDSTDLLDIDFFADITPPESTDDTDYTDFAIFSISGHSCAGKSKNDLVPAVIPESDSRTLLRPEFIFTACGFPKSAPDTEIDYDRKIIRLQRFLCDAKFIGEAESNYCYAIWFIEDRPVSDLDGMSGSPVFAKLLHKGRHLYVLVGVLIREGRFISIEVVKECLRRLNEEKFNNMLGSDA